MAVTGLAMEWAWSEKDCWLTHGFSSRVDRKRFESEKMCHLLLKLKVISDAIDTEQMCNSV